MDKSVLFSVMSLVAVQIYLSFGFYCFKQNTRSLIHRCFLYLCLSYGIWSFAYAFVYIAADQYSESFWNKVSALGWCTFSAISLYLVLLITENHMAKKRITVILIFAPAVLFLYMALFLFGADIETPQIVSSIFYIGNFLFNFISLLLGIVLIYLWGVKNDSKRIKIQARIIVFSCMIPFCLNLLTQTILPRLGYEEFPSMGQLYSIILITGLYIVISKYKFLKLPEKILFDEIEDKIIDMLLYLNEKFEIVRISKNTLNLLEYNEEDLLNKNISVLFNDYIRDQISKGYIRNEKNTYNDVQLTKKYGQNLPANVTFIPVYDHKIQDFLGAVLIIQDISAEYELRRKNEMLHEKTIRDSLTRLYNHQYSIQIIKLEIDKLAGKTEYNALSLAMADIDYFKKVNDTFGHVFGDYVLETVSDILLDNIGDRGYVGRFGGEEFIIILPRTNIEQATEICEKIRNKIEYYDFDNKLKLTVSIGVKQFQNESTMQFLKNTDDLLYKAKQNGRNRVEYLHN